MYWQSLFFLCLLAISDLTTFYFIKVKNLSLSEMSIAYLASFISGVASVMLGGIISDLMI